MKRYVLILGLVAACLAVGTPCQAQNLNPYQAQYINGVPNGNQGTLFRQMTNFLTAPFRMNDLFGNGMFMRGPNIRGPVPNSDDPNYLQYFGYKKYR